MDRASWTSARRAGAVYVVVSLPLHLAWEFAHMPLYRVWASGDAARIAYNGLHCTVGDLMIAATTLAVAVLVMGRSVWPKGRWMRVGGIAVLLGMGYTVFSEWHNVYVLNSWSYAPSMPTLPGLGIGISPLLQWLIVPALALSITRRFIRRSSPIHNNADIR